MADAPIFSSYVEAYMAGSKGGSPAPGYPGSRASTEMYSYGPKGSAERLRKSRNYVDGGSPLPVKTMSVFSRPYKPSAKNAENLDTQHERDKDAFERRANSYRRLAHKGYHHNAPPGSILTTFEKGNIVDRGRGRSDLHESRGVYDPVNHTFRVPPSSNAAMMGVSSSGSGSQHERPGSAPHSRGYAAMHAAQQTNQHERSTTPFEHKLLQASRGTYNPLTHEFVAAPEADYVNRKEKEFERRHGLGHGIRRTQPMQGFDPITGNTSAHSPAPAAASAAAAHSAGPPTTPGAAATAAQQQRPTTAPGSGFAGVRKSMSGPSWGTYNPLTHEWKVKPGEAKFEQQEKLVERQLGVSGQSAGRSATPNRHGIYNPITNAWTVPPTDKRAVEGLSFQPATLFSRPTAATIRM